MTLRLNGSASGYTELEAAPVAGNNKITFPASSGSSGQILKNSNGVLDWSQIRENADGSISLVAGTAAAPSLSFTGDSNTGIYSPGADQVAISTGGSGRLFVDASGNVGVGTGAPSYRLEVNGTISQSSQGTSSALIQAVNAGGIFYHGLDNSAGTTFGQAYAAALWHSGAYPILFATNGTERLRITSAGLVGIGTSSPGDLLTLGADNPYMRFADTNQGGYARIGSINGSFEIDADAGNDGFNPIIQFKVGGSERARIDSSGRVGIGTSSPSASLSVAAITTSYVATSFNIGEPSTSTGRQLYMGYNITDGVGFIQPVHWGTEFKPLVLCPNGGRVGIGTTSPGYALDTRGAIASTSASGIQTVLSFASDGIVGTVSNHSLTFFANNGERARIDTSGRLLVGTSTARSVGTVSHPIQQETPSGSIAGISIVRNSADGAEGRITFGKTRSTSTGGTAAVANGDYLGTIAFAGANGSDLNNFAASIAAIVDGDPTQSATDLPGRLVFSTTADGASSPTERMRITSDGSISTKSAPTSLSQAGLTIYGATGVGPNAVDVTRSGGYVLAINRTTNDGNLIEFYQDTVLEGTISVSGTTVSYNGAHLSRYSQLPGGVERTEILRGTVLSNIDEMCGWGEEENEQLNRMKVSDVEGDPNVSGVFQGWDDDDDTYTDDFYCAMTGDFIIRIAEGVTVQRGDLLMSAGDGTAKPQDDDIIRSKTIAKVTSTNVSCTYGDGSYCVPCVLMAC